MEKENKVDMLTFFDKNYPRTSKIFYQWFITKFPQHTLRQFSKMSLEQRYLCIMGFFGIAYILPEKYTNESLKEDIKKAMQDYEDIQWKYNGKTVPDPMKEIERMPYDERKKFHDSLTEKTEIKKQAQISLSDALIDFIDVNALLAGNTQEFGDTGGTETDNSDWLTREIDECPF